MATCLCIGINVATIKNDFPLSPRNGTYLYQSYQSQVHGKKVSINGVVALFCYNDTFYALDEKCPHLGTSVSMLSCACIITLVCAGQ